MDQERWRKVEMLYHGTLELPGTERRAVYLDAVCAGDAELRREVESLLYQTDREDDFLSEPALTLGMSLLAREREESINIQQLGPYKLIRTLGAGGMGEVYLADDPRLGRLVAIKLLPSYLTAESLSVMRFRQEARAASKISHPHIAHIYETGEVDSRHYLAMEYVEGKTLREVLKGDDHLDSLLALDLALQIAQALAGAHREGVVHRDIKPENVMMRGDGFVKVLDFGVAKLFGVSDGARSEGSNQSLDTTPGVVMGTTAYMSPEQVRGQAVDARTDLWSLGVLLYEMLEGCKPFTGETPADVSAAILTKEPLPCERTEGETRSVILKALNKSANGRYQTAEELVGDLKRLKRFLEFDRHKSSANTDEVVAFKTGEIFTSSPGAKHSTDTVSTSERFRTRRTQISSWWGHLGGATKTFLAAVAIGALTFALGAAAKYLSDSQRAPTQGRDAEQSAAMPVVQISSMAVLPFTNESGDERLDYLSQGLAEDLIRNLGRDSALRVTALSSARKAVAEDSVEVGRKLGVSTIMRGRLRREGGQLVLAPEIINAASGTVLWQDNFNASSGDLLLLRNTMTVIMFTQLQGVIGQNKRIVVSEYPTANSAAYSAYLAGRYAPDRYNVAGLRRAIRSLERAVELDSGYSLAYVALADAYNLMGTFLGQSPDYYQPKAIETIEKALSLDPSLAEGHTLLAKIKMDYERDWTGAEAEFRRAIELNHGYARAHHLYGEVYLSAMGRLDESIRELKLASSLDPLSTGIITGLAWSYMGKHEYERAIALCDEALAIDPTDWSIYSYRAMALMKLGRFDEAIANTNKASELDGTGTNWSTLGAIYGLAGRRAEAEKALEQLRPRRGAGRSNISAYDLAIVYAALGDKDEAFKLLREEAKTKSVDLLSIRIDPMLDVLRQDARFHELEQTYHFPKP